MRGTERIDGRETGRQRGRSEGRSEGGTVGREGQSEDGAGKEAGKIGTAKRTKKFFLRAKKQRAAGCRAGEVVV